MNAAGGASRFHTQSCPISCYGIHLDFAFHSLKSIQEFMQTLSSPRSCSLRMDIKNCPISIVYFVYVQHAACNSLKTKQIEFYLVLDTILRFNYSVSTLHSSLEDTMTLYEYNVDGPNGRQYFKG